MSKAAPRRALICGVSGQDGAYLAQLLLEKGYEVHGTSRDVTTRAFPGLDALGIRDRVRLLSMSIVDFRSVREVLKKVQPAEVYNLSGQSSVGLSFDQPVETFDSIGVGTLNLLEAIRESSRLGQPQVRFYNAGSGECFGDTGEHAADESTRLAPSSPYAVAKSAATWSTATYRQAYDLYAVTGLLFNHESPLRPARFVTQKIVSAAVRIAGGSKERLALGNTRIVRDWGWAPEYVDAMWRMLQQDQPGDLVVATGKSFSLEDFVAAAFGEVGLDWKQHVDIDRQLFRPYDHMAAHANPARAHQKLGWKARHAMPDVARMMVAAALGRHG